MSDVTAPTLPLLGADATRRAGLRRMRAVATLLLALAALVFALTHDRAGGWGYVNAAAEAAMVGAIADWFAVTALFRRPLGLPIPHTALVPRKKDQLAAGLQDFVAQNFLREDVVRERVAAAEPAQRAGRWVSMPGRAPRLVAEGSRVASDLLGRIDESDVRAIMTEVVFPRLTGEPLSAAAGQLLGDVVGEGAHAVAVDLALDELHGWLLRHPERITELIVDRAPHWSPRWANTLVADKLFREALSWVADIRDDRDHDVRTAIDQWLRDLARDLQHDPATMARAERLKARLLAQSKAAEAAVRLWDSFRRGLIDALDVPDGLLRRRLVEEVEELGRRLQDEPELAARVDRWVSDAAAYAVNHYGAEVATVISSTVERWDGRETAERIELHVGRDLQFIRINGTVVGGLVGLLIHAAAQLL